MRYLFVRKQENFKILEIISPRVILQGLYLNKPIKLTEEHERNLESRKWNNSHVPERKNSVGNDANSSQL